MLDHHRRWCHFWLGCVPIGFGLVQLGRQRLVKPPIIDGSFKVALPAELAETDQTFFALIKVRICSTSWMMLLLLSGLIAISSLTAATMIQKAGWDRKSMTAKQCFVGVYSLTGKKQVGA
jgi:hypothetical protein